jgi:hypothetical protein
MDLRAASNARYREDVEAMSEAERQARFCDPAYGLSQEEWDRVRWLIRTAGDKGSPRATDQATPQAPRPCAEPLGPPQKPWEMVKWWIGSRNVKSVKDIQNHLGYKSPQSSERLCNV